MRSKSFVFQKKATILCNAVKGGSSASGLGHLSKCLPQAPKF